MNPPNPSKPLESKVQPFPDSASNSLSNGPLSAGNHKIGCPCKLCDRVRARRAAGKPTVIDAEVARKAAVATRRATRKAKLKPSEVRAAVAASLETQVALGQTPNAGLAGRIAGVSSRHGQEVAKGENLVQTALEKNGISDDRLFSLASSALDAENTKLITDSDGNIIEAIKLPDWQNRHRFWRDILMVKGYLGSERENIAAGGLMLILPDQARVIAGHSPTCTCDQCTTAWNERTKKIQQQAMRSMSIDAEIADNPQPLPPTLPDESED